MTFNLQPENVIFIKTTFIRYRDRTRPGMVDPKLVWTPAVAPSGLAFYNGDLFAGGLRSADVRHIDLDEKGNVVSRNLLR